VNIRSSITVNRSIETVFSWFADREHLAYMAQQEESGKRSSGFSFIPNFINPKSVHLQGIRHITEGPLHVGTLFLLAYASKWDTSSSEISVVITEYVPPRLIAFKFNDNVRIPNHLLFAFVPVADSTQISCVAKVEDAKVVIFKLIKPLIVFQMKKWLRPDMQRLKAMLETQ